jgi:hypothetical protein
MLASAGTEIDRGRGGLASLASEPGEDGGEGRVAVIAHEQPDGDDGLTPAARQLQPALWPVGQVVRYAECRRVHRRMIERERRGNKGGRMRFTAAVWDYRA